jgi:hypothetical protein
LLASQLSGCGGGGGNNSLNGSQVLANCSNQSSGNNSGNNSFNNGNGIDDLTKYNKGINMGGHKHYYQVDFLFSSI